MLTHLSARVDAKFPWLTISFSVIAILMTLHRNASTANKLDSSFSLSDAIMARSVYGRSTPCGTVYARSNNNKSTNVNNKNSNSTNMNSRNSNRTNMNNNNRSSGLRVSSLQCYHRRVDHVDKALIDFSLTNPSPTDSSQTERTLVLADHKKQQQRQQ